MLLCLWSHSHKMCRKRDLTLERLSQTAKSGSGLGVGVGGMGLLGGGAVINQRKFMSSAQGFPHSLTWGAWCTSRAALSTLSNAGATKHMWLLST